MATAAPREAHERLDELARKFTGEPGFYGEYGVIVVAKDSRPIETRRVLEQKQKLD